MSLALRAYQVRVYKQNKIQEFGAKRNQIDLKAFLNKFFLAHKKVAPYDGDKTLAFKDLRTKDHYIEGVIDYGSYGSASTLRDIATNSVEFHRRPNHADTIPLYFCFYTPEDAKFGICAFQSYKGRSCISTVQGLTTKTFEAEHFPRLTYKKVMPQDGPDLLNKPVSRLRLIRKSQSSDRAKNMLGTYAVEHDLELVLKAKRHSGFGHFGPVGKLLRGQGPRALVYDGVQYDDAKADVRIGGQYRPVGIFQLSDNHGTIDITDEVTVDANGVPNINQIRRETRKIINDLFRRLV